MATSKVEASMADGAGKTVIDGDRAASDTSNHDALPTSDPPPTDTTDVSKGQIQAEINSVQNESSAGKLRDKDRWKAGPINKRRRRLYASDNSSSDPDSEEEFPISEEDHKIIAKYWSTVSLYKTYALRLGRDKEKAKRSGKAPTMVRGVIDYVQTLEDRIQKLEAAETDRLERVKSSHAAVEANDTDTNAKNEWGGLVQEVKFFHAKGEFGPDGQWNDNNLKKGSYQCKLDPNHLIRVLYDWADDVEPQSISGGSPEPDSIDIIAFGIMSKPVATFFSKRLGLGGDLSHPVRFGKPFRPLIRNLQPLREQLAKLEEKFRSTDSSHKGTETITHDDALPFPRTPPNDEEPVAFETAEALMHFRMLLEFADKYLAKQLELFERLRLGLEDKITFENLWMLFDTGVAIHSPSVTGGAVFRNDDEFHTTKTRYCAQVFRVLIAKGGLLTKKSLAPRQATKDEDVTGLMTVADLFIRGVQRETLALGRSDIRSVQRNKDRFIPLEVTCFHIDFDGTNYGTVREIFSFKPFDGVMDIRSLVAYPVTYLKSQPVRPLARGNEVESDALLERGKRFIDIASVAHMSYEGLTVGKSREEINSSVIVDFKLSFEEYKNRFSDPENVMPKLTSLNGFFPPARDGETLDFYTNKCSDMWCHKFDCVNDPYYKSHDSRIAKVDDNVKALLEEYEGGGPNQEVSLQRFKGYMEENDLIRLLPGVVPGFALRNRKWVQLDLDQLKPLQQGDDWKSLVLPTGHREMVQAMVETHTRGSRESVWEKQNAKGKVQMDLVQGKGKGCIILLHGVPGVGKTSTAECVATYTRRPLYPITCGDIGYLPEQVEANMEQHFKLAHKCGCVLLLDEADVFLAKRDRADVKRNGLVSVFLRILEYYSGILFLTTNRVGAIDDAFRSRLHLTLYYPKLNERQTIKIWKNSLSRMKTINQEREERNQLPIEFKKDKILRWVEANNKTLQWNGRQIRNAFQTAVALAEFDAKHGTVPSFARKKADSKKGSNRTPGAPFIDVGYFNLIATASTQFSEYLHATLGESEDTRAARDQNRTSSFMPKMKVQDLEEETSSSSSSSEGSSSEDDTDAEAKSHDRSEVDSSDESSEVDDSELERKKSSKKKRKAAASKSKSSKEKKKKKKEKVK